MQQTYIDAFYHFDHTACRDEASFVAWLSIIADRNLMDALRMLEAEKRGGGHHRIQSMSREESFVLFVDMLSSGGTTPSVYAARAEAHAAVKDAINRLPESHRRAVQMYDIEGRSINEVAAVLNKRPGAVHMIRARAHRRLREMMGSESAYLSKP
jgi:RNA polymerase sigma factor (sigma-70 family)